MLRVCILYNMVALYVALSLLGLIPRLGVQGLLSVVFVCSPSVRLIGDTRLDKISLKKGVNLHVK